MHLDAPSICVFVFLYVGSYLLFYELRAGSQHFNILASSLHDTWQDKVTNTSSQSGRTPFYEIPPHQKASPLDRTPFEDTN